MSGNGKKVFLTGASGFVASHILSQLIEEEYKPTASVRSQPKADQILEVHPEWKGKVEFAFVPDIAVPGAFNDALAAEAEKGGFDYIIHTASPVTFTITDVKKDLIDPAVNGTLEALKAAHEKGGKQLKRFVLLGSAVSILNSYDDQTVRGKPYTEDDWNPVTEADAVSSQNPVLGYNTGKVKAERAAWAYLEENKSVFDLAVVNPDVILGPMLQPVPGPKNVNETNDFACYAFFNGTHKAVEDVQFPFLDFTDVRDVALLHVLALTSPLASNKRILTTSGPLSPQLIVNTIRKNFPELESRLPKGGDESLVFPKGLDPTPLNPARSLEIFRDAKGKDWEYRGLEESLTDTVKCILDLEKKWNA
ncbi:hypothetical protein CJF32_00003952 [Rutstroemia sp. NJR-2017a WRK4]|nr:hypothetical protein CJF32_00003952 [Rutstroemia sp. NJR-2017a WRK4]